MRLKTYSLFIIFLLAACSWDGWGPSSDRTRRNVSPEDIQGVYEFTSYDQASKKSRPAILEITTSGRFTITGSFERSGYGAWELTSKNDLSFLYENRGMGSTGNMYVVDSLDGKFDLYGGDGIHTRWERFRKVR